MRVFVCVSVRVCVCVCVCVCLNIELSGATGLVRVCVCACVRACVCGTCMCVTHTPTHPGVAEPQNVRREFEEAAAAGHMSLTYR